MNSSIDHRHEYLALLSLKQAEILRQRLCPESYDVFLKYLYIDLQTIFSLIEAAGNRNTKREDSITIQIVNMLKMKDYDASHDRYNRGHADITVQKDCYKWIAEAKIYTDYKWLYKGLIQLIKRYSISKVNENEGALIIYFFHSDVNKIVKNWKDKIENEYSLNTKHKDNLKLKSINLCQNISNSLISIHTHHASGIDYTVKHFSVHLNTDV